MELKNLPWWGKLLIAVVVCGALIWSQYQFMPLGLNDKTKEIKTKTDQLDRLQADILKGKQAQAQLDELQRDIAALEQKLTDLRQILPTEPELGDLLKWIKALADQTNLELQVFNPQGLTEQEFLREQPIRMEVIGTYHQLGMFFDRVSKYARIINVENVGIKPAPDRRDSSYKATIGASFTSKTFIYREDAEMPGGGA